MIGLDQLWVEVACNLPGRTQSRFICAACVRAGSRSVHVYATREGVTSHLFIEHQIGQESQQ